MEDDEHVFYNFTSFNFPPTIYKYDIATKKSCLPHGRHSGFKPENYETKQIFYQTTARACRCFWSTKKA